MRRLNISSRDFLFWVLGGEGGGGRGEGSEVKHDCASTLGSVGPKGCFYWGLTNVPEKLEMSQSL